jgi:hypothetical protein
LSAYATPVGEDWADDPALFFRVLLKDSSDTQMVLRDEGAGRRVFDLSRLITDALTNEVHADDLQPYFAFRSVSEQEKLRDPKWD